MSSKIKIQKGNTIKVKEYSAKMVEEAFNLWIPIAFLENICGKIFAVKGVGELYCKNDKYIQSYTIETEGINGELTYLAISEEMIEKAVTPNGYIDLL